LVLVLAILLLLLVTHFY